MPLWLVSAYQWVRTHWRWLLFPLGIGLWLLGRAGRKSVTVVSSELEGQARVEADAGQLANVKSETARDQRDAGISEVEKSIDAKLEAQRKDALATASALQDDPEGLTNFLKDVGKNVRGE